MNIAKTIKEVLVEPSAFFKKKSKEKGIQNEIYFLLIFAFFAYMFLTYRNIELLNQYSIKIAGAIGTDAALIPINIYTLSAAYLVFVSSFIGLSFLRYSVTHWFVILFRGKYAYDKTYKAMVYSLSPEFLTSPLLLLMIVVPLLIKNTIMMWAVIAVLAAIILSISLYQVLLRTKALAQMQKIKWIYAFLSIYVFGSALLLVIAIVVAVVFASIISGFILLFGGII